MSSKWYQLGIQLLDECQAPQLEIIRANNDDVTGCCTALFGYWLQTHPNASWYELVTALRAPGVELNEVAASVERTFPSKTHWALTVHMLISFYYEVPRHSTGYSETLSKQPIGLVKQNLTGEAGKFTNCNVLCRL